MSKSDIFQYLNNCYTKAEPVTSGQGQPDSTYMAARWLSLNPNLLLRVAQANVKAGRLPPWATGALLFHIVPPGSPQRFKYPSKGKKPKGPKQEVLKALSEHFNCKESHAVQIHDLLTAQGIDVRQCFGDKLKGK
jgi:hypothetical protein